MMARKMGCTNEACESRRKNVKYKASMKFCPQCGSELKPVCKSHKCSTFLDDGGHALCATCRAKRDDRIDGAKKKGVAGLSLAGGGLLLVASKGKDIAALAARLLPK